MASSLHSLPPSKRFKLLHSHHPSSDPHVLQSLPARKRFKSFDSHLQTIPTSCCLPAKKRVWALPPLSPVKHPTLRRQSDEEVEEEEEDDDGVVCLVCQSTDGDPVDPIVICDGCDLMVHASCYGNPLIKFIPEGDWYCSRCEKRKDVATACCLCPVRSGALKPTLDGEWAHVVCALFVPEVFFEDPEGREGIDCSRIPTKRREIVCYVCETKNGCAVECSESGCGLGFHVGCGLEKGLCIEYKEGRGKGIVAGFCEEHTKLWEKQQLTGKFKIVARDDELKRKNKA